MNPIAGHQVFIVEVTSDAFDAGRIENIEADSVVALLVVALVVHPEYPLLGAGFSLAHPMNIARAL
jgi:hypothetical protein